MNDKRFEYRKGKDDHVEVFHDGRLATRLKGKAALKFLARVEHAGTEAQQLEMARVTGQYKFGNERQARQTRRLRGRSE